jgi:Ca2+-binding EF-hand superfamily protein
MPLTQEEIDGCRDAFLAFDKDRSGTIDVWELRQVLEGERTARGGGEGAFESHPMLMRTGESVF